MKFVSKAAIGGLLWLTFGAAMFGDTYGGSRRTMGATPEPEAVMMLGAVLLAMASGLNRLKA
jgi:hypothetical protein